MGIWNMMKLTGDWIVGVKPSYHSHEKFLRRDSGRGAGFAGGILGLFALAADNVVSTIRDTPPHGGYIALAGVICTPVAVRLFVAYAATYRRKIGQIPAVESYGPYVPLRQRLAKLFLQRSPVN